MRHAVHLAVDRVVRLVLQQRVDVGVVREDLRVDRSDVAAGDHPHRRVARCRDAVIAPGAHERHHLVRRSGGLRVDLAAGLLLEGRHPVDALVGRAVFGVPRPDDEVQLALARADRADDRDVRHLELTGARTAAAVVVAAARGSAEGNCDRQDDERDDALHAVPSSERVSARPMANVWSSRHATRT